MWQVARIAYWTILQNKARATNTTLVTGIFGETQAGLHNSITSLGNGEGIYHKQKLVPFGEYVPMRAVLLNLLKVFDSAYVFT